jgi:hypothetical protein
MAACWTPKSPQLLPGKAQGLADPQAAHWEPMHIRALHPTLWHPLHQCLLPLRVDNAIRQALRLAATSS